MKKLFLSFLLLCLAGPALAQQPVVTLPSARSLLNSSSTVAVTNTFQQVFASNSNRLGCTIQNNDTNSMWVFLGAAASATKATSVVLAAGQAMFCQSGGLTYSGEISITGTATGAFYAGGQ